MTMFFYNIRTMLIATMFALATISTSHADEAPDGYPGNWERPDGKTVVGVNIALRLVQEGIYAFQYSYGRWPDSWSEVVNAGICQISIVSPQGFLIDPDDSSLDFLWDVSYIPASDYYSPPKTVSLMDADSGAFTLTDPFESNPSLEEMVMQMEPELAEKYSGLVDIQEWRNLAAIRRYCNNMMFEYYKLKGWPDWQEFYGSMWCPIDDNSVNPYTGSLFSLDGSPDDLVVTIANKEGMLSVQITNNNGEIPFSVYP